MIMIMHLELGMPGNRRSSVMFLCVAASLSGAVGCAHGNASADRAVGFDAEKDEYYAGTNHPDVTHFSNASRESLKKRLAFELECDEELELQRLSTQRLQQQSQQTWGVRGCGAKYTYLVNCMSNWGTITCSHVMDSANDGASGK